MPVVTVLTPTFQHAAFIGSCIQSVRAQTVRDWEMVVVDDGSEDGTPEIAESFHDPRIHVLSRPHEGVAGLGRSYALALARSRSPYVAILEGDDAWPPTKLEYQLPLFEDPGVVLAYGAAELVDESGSVYARYRHAPRGAISRNDPVGSIVPALVALNFIVAVTVMARRSALEQVGGFLQPDDIPYVDHPTWLRLARVGRFARSEEVVGQWRRYGSQITTRSWLGGTPDRTPYLRAIAEEFHDLDAREWATLMSLIDRDSFRQRQEAVIARGRIALVEGRWREAAQAFARIMREGEPRSRVVAAAGLVAAGMRTDLEGLIAAAGRHSLPSRRHLASRPDPPTSAEQGRPA